MILPAFAKSAAHALDVRALQQFATTLQRELSPKTVVNILEKVFAVLRYAKKSGMRTETVSFSDLTLRAAETPERPYFTSEQVKQIVRAAREPYKTMFALASLMGARARTAGLDTPRFGFRAKDNSGEQIGGRPNQGCSSAKNEKVRGLASDAIESGSIAAELPHTSLERESG